MQDHLSLTFSALADPTRRAMLARLSNGEANVSDLAKPFLDEMSLPAVTKHLQVLEKAGLITKTRKAQWRSCKINGDGLKDAADWMEQYRVFWEESFDRLDVYLKSLSANDNANANANPATPQPTGPDHDKDTDSSHNDTSALTGNDIDNEAK